MDSLRHFPLGASFPESPHAVISSLPTLADVRAYEEQDPRVLDALRSAYPRFVMHRYVEQLMRFYLQREGLVGQSAVLVSGRRAADDALAQLGVGCAKREVDTSVFLLYCEAANKACAHRLRKFIQHTGCMISSREAEDLLLTHGLLLKRFPEAYVTGHALSQVEAELAKWMGCRAADVLVCASGMNAFYAGFRAVQDFQSGRGRNAWLQLGWLYLDSGKVLEQFLEDEASLECLYEVSDTEAVLNRIRSYGESLAAVVVECPSNPLIRLCDLQRIAAAVRQQGGIMIVDPTIASIYNIGVMPFADLLTTSLTKYASIEGDIMMGALAVNPEMPFYGDLILRTSSFHVPPYRRDLARIAFEMIQAPDRIKKMNLNASKLAAFLRNHPAVREVYYAGDSEFMDGLARSQGAFGAVLSVVLLGEMEKFYDAVRVMKGPSFGTGYTLLCPFLYLAHYDLVTSERGRAFLREIGIEPELIRISVGTEPYHDIEAVLGAALEASLK